MKDDSLEPFIVQLIDNTSSPFWQALNVLSNALMVRPITNNTITPTCERFTSGLNAGYCNSSTIQQTCQGLFNVPDELSGFVMSCESENSSSCFVDGPSAAGVDADYILFVGSVYGNNELINYQTFK